MPLHLWTSARYTFPLPPDETAWLAAEFVAAGSASV
jgi:hypothetical protein